MTSSSFRILILVLLLNVTASSKEEYQRSRFKSLECKSRNESIIVYNYCRVKVTRTTSVLAFNATILRPIKRPVYAKYKVSYKYGQIYRDIIPLPEFELCSIIRKPEESHPLVREVLKGLWESLGALKNGCPVSGELNLRLELDLSQFPSIIPSGYYAIETSMRTGSTPFLYTKIQLEIVSSIKTSF